MRLSHSSGLDRRSRSSAGRPCSTARGVKRRGAFVACRDRSARAGRLRARGRVAATGHHDAADPRHRGDRRGGHPALRGTRRPGGPRAARGRPALRAAPGGSRRGAARALGRVRGGGERRRALRPRAGPLHAAAARHPYRRRVVGAHAGPDGGCGARAGLGHRARVAGAVGVRAAGARRGGRARVSPRRDGITPTKGPLSGHNVRVRPAGARRRPTRRRHRAAAAPPARPAPARSSAAPR